MWHEERHQRIRNLLATFGRVTVDRLTSEMEVSRETARRDLLEMEAAGELRRVRGGAVALEPRAEAPFTERAQSRLKEKRMIAKAAAALVSSGQSLFLDAGSTTTLLAEALSALSGLTIITNSIEAALKLSHATANRVVLIGGELRNDPPATVGALAINEIARYRVDFAMLSPYSFDPEQGAGSYEPEEAEVARAMVAHAERVVILADHSKLGLSGRIAYCAPAQVDHLVVDAQARTSAHWPALEQTLADLIVASRA